MIDVSSDEVNYWLGQGFSMDEIKDATAKMGSRVGNSNATSVFSQGGNDNLGKSQIDVNPTLERIEHLLRGDKISFVNGNVVWVKADNLKNTMFNDFGVASIMEVISSYVNPIVILSNYSEEQINEKMLNFGMEVNNLIFMKYQEFGMDSCEKRKFYPIVVRQLIDIVHATYLRALGGADRESLRRMISVNQSEPLQSGNPMLQQRSILNPMRWISGKYKT